MESKQNSWRQSSRGGNITEMLFTPINVAKLGLKNRIVNGSNGDKRAGKARRNGNCQR